MRSLFSAFLSSSTCQKSLRALRVLGILPLLGVLAIGTSAYLGSQNAALSARIAHLEAVMRLDLPTDISDLEERIARMQEGEETPDEARVRSLIASISTLEQALDYPVVSAQETSDLVGKMAAVYGRATARISGSHVFLSFADSAFSAPAFNQADTFPVSRVNSSPGIVVRGVIGTYEGNPQIIINEISQVTFP